MGMGLTIVWRVATSLGGTLSVESEPGQGPSSWCGFRSAQQQQRGAA